MARPMKELLKNKYVLYLVVFIAFANLLGYVMLHNTDAVVVFLIIGLLTSFFNKNMIIISLSAMIFTNLLVSLRRHEYYREGLKNKQSGQKANNSVKNKKKKEPLHNSQKLSDEEEEEPIKSKNQQVKSAPVKIDREMADGGHGTDIDQAATLEKAYDKLDDLFSKTQKGNMTEDAKNVAIQQQVLMENLKNLEPMVGKATAMLDKMGGIEGLTSMMSGLGNVMGKLDNFTGKK